MNNIQVTQIYTPCGEMFLCSHMQSLIIAEWGKFDADSLIFRRCCSILEADYNLGSSDAIEQATRELQDYFSGTLKRFETPFLLLGTEFQKRVWRELYKIPYGSLKSYSDIAKSIGSESSVRAVANAIGANRLNIFIPCHRVVGKNHSLTGYRGGLQKKEFLLKIENPAFIF